MLKFRHFDIAEDVTYFVNNNKVKVISIIYKNDRFLLFYESLI